MKLQVDGNSVPNCFTVLLFKFIFIVSTERGIGEEFIMGPFLLNSVFRLS